MLFGCFYGALKSSQCSLSLLESLQNEFTQRCLPLMNAFECFEIIEAACVNKNPNYEALNYMHEYVMAKLVRV
jgi:hypothetical protein